MPDYATTGFNPDSASLSDDVHFYTDPYMANTNGNHNATRTQPSLATSSSPRNGPSHVGDEQTTAREEIAERFRDVMFLLLKEPQVGSVVLTEEMRADDPKQTIFTASGRKKDCNNDGPAATMANLGKAERWAWMSTELISGYQAAVQNCMACLDRSVISLVAPSHDVP
ncbi:hypothetical protein LTR49_024554 [Elasticomyces elasticus]|nr:hypothetical protein LTR49_024554 [Elasticomyces elasticus]